MTQWSRAPRGEGRRATRLTAFHAALFRHSLGAPSLENPPGDTTIILSSSGSQSAVGDQRTSATCQEKELGPAWASRVTQLS